MAGLSNFLRAISFVKNGGGAAPAPIFRLAQPAEAHAALSLILGTATGVADAQTIADFCAYLQSRQIDLNELWVVEINGAMVWATLPLVSPGRTMLLFTPGSAMPVAAGDAVAGALGAICARFARADIQLAQVLLDPQDDAAQRVFERQQFARMAELIYLQTTVRKPPPPPPLEAGLKLHPYSPQTHGLFARAIAASYRDSLDCPLLNGVRQIDDIIAGHKASGDFDPRHWFVICRDRGSESLDEPLGVLLLARLPRGDTVELVYIGLAPEARGQKIAAWLMRLALHTTWQIGIARLTLAVDSINAPALKLYYRFGLSRVGSKVAMMRNLVETA